MVIQRLTHVLTGSTRPIRAAAKAVTFLVKVYPMLPSRPVDWLTSPPVVERVRYPTRVGGVPTLTEGDLYRPAAPGPHPGMMICLGVVPFGVDHPQVPRLGAALARAGFAALMYWSPTMRDRRLDPEDIENIALAYDWLMEHPAIDATRSRLMGTCVGGSFALMAAASPRIRDRVAFVVTDAPYSSMWTLTQDIVTSTRSWGTVRDPWPVDPLTRTVYVRSLTAGLDPQEADLLRRAALGQGDQVDLAPQQLSEEGRAIYPLLTGLSSTDVQAALQRLPPALHERLAALSPLQYVQDIRAPLLVILHDRDDLVIPVGESRRLWAALAGRTGVSYTEFTLFQHMDPTKGRLSPLGLMRQLGKFFHAVYPVFRLAAAP